MGIIGLLVLNVCLVYLFNFSNVVKGLIKFIYGLFGKEYNNEVFNVGIFVFWLSFILSIGEFGWLYAFGISVGFVFSVKVINIVIKLLNRVIKYISDRV